MTRGVEGSTQRVPGGAGRVLLVIGYGNTLRRDDGAGIALAAALTAVLPARGQPVHSLTVPQLMPEVAAEMAAEAVAAVVFVDAALVPGRWAIQIEQIAEAVSSPALGHQLAPATLLLYARLLYGRQPPAWLVTVPGVDFGLGAGFSPAVARLLAGAPRVADQLLSEMETVYDA